MKIEICKKSAYFSEYTITRKDRSQETFVLETKTYLVHDLCHFVVEKRMQYSRGFWGMLASGFPLNKLVGKENPLTNELRLIEQIVGPVQSVFMGHMPLALFPQLIEHLNYELPEGLLSDCLLELTQLELRWKTLVVGKSLSLDWNISCLGE